MAAVQLLEELSRKPRAGGKTSWNETDHRWHVTDSILGLIALAVRWTAVLCALR
jgi:hypothetical protein